MVQKVAKTNTGRLFRVAPYMGYGVLLRKLIHPLEGAAMLEMG